MKNLLLICTFLLSLTFGYAEEGSKRKKQNQVPKAGITYREHKVKKTVVRKNAPKKHMFDGEGPQRSEFSMFGKVEKRTGKP